MWYDLIVIAILLFAAYRGLQRGIIYQIATIASVVLCFIFAEAISAAVAPAIPLDPPLNNWIVMVGAYVFFSFVAFGFARVLDTWVEKAKMKEFNRFLGGSFGLAKGALLCLVLTFFAVTMSEKARIALKDSKSAMYAAIIMDRLHPVMPEKLQGALDKYLAFYEGTFEHDGEHNHNYVNDPLTDPFGDLGSPSGGLGQPSTTQPGTSNPFDLFGGSGANNPSYSNTSTTPGLPQMPAPNQTNPYINQPSQTNPYINQTQQPTAPSTDIDAIIDRLPWTLSGELERIVRLGLQSAPPQQRLQMEQQLNRTPPQKIGELARAWISGDFSGGTSTQTQPAPSSSTAPRDFFGNVAGNLYDRATGTNTQPGNTNPTRDYVRDLAGNWIDQQLNGTSTTTPQQPQQQQPQSTANPNTLITQIARMYSRNATEQASNEQGIRRYLQGLSQQAAAAVLIDWNADITGQGVDPDPTTNRNTDIQTRIQRVNQRLSAQPGQYGGQYGGQY